jgi:hypothetical protein
MPNWLLAGGEVVTGASLLVGVSFLVAILRPPQGALQERAVVSFPAAWIIVGLTLTAAYACSIALVLVGLGILR